MKIAVLFSGKIGAAWSVSDGLVTTLREMGHEAEGWAFDRVIMRPLTVGMLNSSDLVLVSGLEHFDQQQEGGLFSVLSREDWAKVTTPKVAWFHESFFRDDRTFDFKVLRPLADKFFFPAIQDAEMFDHPQYGAAGDCHFMPFGVDTNMFRPVDGVQRLLPVGFIGSFYPKRVAYLNALLNHIKVPLIAGGNVVVQDMDGVDAEATANRLAMNYSRIHIFLNLPAYSRLLVTKVYEAMACGCMVITPALAGVAERNMEPFIHAKHLVYYKESNQGFVNQILREYIEREEQRKLIMASGRQEVLDNHSLTKRLTELLASSGVKDEAEMVKVVL